MAHFKSLAEKKVAHKRNVLSRWPLIMGYFIWTFYKTNKYTLRLAHFFDFIGGSHSWHNIKQRATFWYRHLPLFILCKCVYMMLLTVSICLINKGRVTFFQVIGPRENTQ